MTPEKFTSPAGNVAIAYDEKSATARVDIFFRSWGACYEERCVSSTADAIQRVLKRLEHKQDAVEIARQLEARLEDMKQGELFAREG